MKVVVIKKVNTPKETNPVTIPMEGVEAIIAEKEAAEKQMLKMQKDLQEAYALIGRLNDEVDTLQNSLTLINAERRKLLDKLTANNSTEGCSDCACKGESADAANSAMRRVFLVYI